MYTYLYTYMRIFVNEYFPRDRSLVAQAAGSSYHTATIYIYMCI